jgi:hypothetical protein
VNTEQPAAVTTHAGLLLVIEALRSLGLARAVDEHLHFKQRLRGYSEATCVETLVALVAAGGECVDDVRGLAADNGLQRLWGRRPPAAERLRSFLDRCHDEAVLAGRVAHTAFVPPDSAGLRGLVAVQGQGSRRRVRRSGAIPNRPPAPTLR